VSSGKRKPNFLIVWNYLAAKPGERKVELFPDHAIEHGVYNNRLHHILHKSGEDVWCVSDIPINAFVKACEELDESKIMSMVFEEGMRKSKL
jgi:hypothetical protein